MTDDGQEAEISKTTPFYGDHRFLAFIIISIIISMCLVCVSIAMYYRSGAALLDLSRPGYTEVRSKVVAKDESFLDFPLTGAITKTVIDDFQIIYDQQAAKAQSVDAFGSDPLDPNALWLIVLVEQ